MSSDEHRDKRRRVPEPMPWLKFFTTGFFTTYDAKCKVKTVQGRDLFIRLNRDGSFNIDDKQFSTVKRLKSAVKERVGPVDKVKWSRPWYTSLYYNGNLLENVDTPAASNQITFVPVNPAPSPKRVSSPSSNVGPNFVDMAVRAMVNPGGTLQYTDDPPSELLPTIDLPSEGVVQALLALSSERAQYLQAKTSAVTADQLKDAQAALNTLCEKERASLSANWTQHFEVESLHLDKMRKTLDEIQRVLLERSRKLAADEDTFKHNDTAVVQFHHSETQDISARISVMQDVVVNLYTEMVLAKGAMEALQATSHAHAINPARLVQAQQAFQEAERKYNEASKQ